MGTFACIKRMLEHNYKLLSSREKLSGRKTRKLAASSFSVGIILNALVFLITVQGDLWRWLYAQAFNWPLFKLGGSFSTFWRVDPDHSSHFISVKSPKSRECKNNRSDGHLTFLKATTPLRKIVFVSFECFEFIFCSFWSLEKNILIFNYCLWRFFCKSGNDTLPSFPGFELSWPDRTQKN